MPTLGHARVYNGKQVKNTWFLPSLAYNQLREIGIKQVNKQTLSITNCGKCYEGNSSFQQ